MDDPHSPFWQNGIITIWQYAGQKKHSPSHRAGAFCVSFGLHSPELWHQADQSYGTRQTKWEAMAPGRPNETYGWVKIPFGPINQIISHWFQLPGATLEWPPITRPGVNATKYRKPWPRTDIIVRWPHDCLSPIMRWPQLKPGRTVSGGALQYYQKLQIGRNLTFDRGLR